jgi:hypothetical protein
MARLLCSMILVAMCGSMTGCALYVDRTFRDVSTEPGYAVDYHVGDVYRLRTDGQLVACASDNGAERFELWPPQVVSQNAGHPGSGSVVTVAPAGSILRIDGLEHSRTVMLPIPLPGDSDVLSAYGTLSTSAGSWHHVRIANALHAKWSFVPGTYVMAFPPDEAFLERVPPTVAPAPRPAAPP